MKRHRRRVKKKPRKIPWGLAVGAVTYASVVALCVRRFVSKRRLAEQSAHTARQRQFEARHTASHTIVLVGGLQRSGTTVGASLLLELLDASGQSFRAATKTSLAQVREWRGLSRSYFRDVLKSGGLEGKFVQNVYPYLYFLRDWSGHVEHFAGSALAGSVEDNGQKLWDEWSQFWDTSKSILVEKTPENIAMAPFLQALLHGARKKVAFLAVLRHPLGWSLAVDKWLVNKWNKDKTQALRPIEARIAMWIAVVRRFFDDAPRVGTAVALHAEHLDTAPNRRNVMRQLVWKLVNGDIRKGETAAFRGFARRDLFYVACWLEAGKVSANGRCASVDGAVRSSRRREFDDLVANFETVVNSFGYTLHRDIPSTLCDDLQGNCRFRGDTMTDMETRRLLLKLEALDPAYRPYCVL